jgi:hypothetical protein
VGRPKPAGGDVLAFDVVSEAVRRVSDAELEYDGELVYRWKGELLSGIGFSDDPVRSEVTYEGGQQSGPARIFFPSGRVSAESWHHESTLHGWRRTFTEDGQVLTEALYEFGMPVSPSSGRAVEPTHQLLLDRLRAETRGWPSVR